MDINKVLDKEVPECYYLMAMLMGAVDYYMMYESWSGKPDEEDMRKHELGQLPHATEIMDELNTLVKDVFLDEADALKPSETAKHVFELREKIKNLAVELISYSDNFKLYEYLINRTKPVDRTQLKQFNNDAEARDVLSAIFASGENAEINENIKLAVSQLPLRMSKAKFFDIVHNALSKYTGTDSSSLEREMYMLRTTSGLYERSDATYPELADALKFFGESSFEDLDDAKHALFEGKMVQAVQLITDLSEFFQTAETIVNRITVMLLCRGHVERIFDKERAGVRVLIEEAVEGFKKDSREEMSDDVLKCLQSMEGIFEPLTEKMQRIQMKASKTVKGEVSDEMKEHLDNLNSCERLISPSVFADLKEPESHELTQAEVDKEVDGFRDELSKVLANDSKMMQRARMSAVLSQLPVFFESRTEVMNYVRDSLDGCRDVYEKMVAVRLILDTAGSNK